MRQAYQTGTCWLWGIGAGLFLLCIILPLYHIAWGASPNDALKPKHEVPSDADSLRAVQIEEALKRDAKLASLHLVPEVKGDHVILYGKVHNVEESKRATKIAHAFAGIVRVTNRMTIEPNTASGPAPKSIPHTPYHVVTQGESLQNVATQHGMMLNELKHLNHLTSNRIRIGQRLRIRRVAGSITLTKQVQVQPKIQTSAPIGSPKIQPASSNKKVIVTSKPATLSPKTIVTTPKKSRPTHLSNSKPGRYHTMKAGETLWSISRRYHTTVAHLLNLNDIDPNDIPTGYRLCLEISR